MAEDFNNRSENVESSNNESQASSENLSASQFSSNNDWHAVTQASLDNSKAGAQSFLDKTPLSITGNEKDPGSKSGAGTPEKSGGSEKPGMIKAEPSNPGNAAPDKFAPQRQEIGDNSQKPDDKGTPVNVPADAKPMPRDADPKAPDAPKTAFGEQSSSQEDPKTAFGEQSSSKAEASSERDSKDPNKSEKDKQGQEKDENKKTGTEIKDGDKPEQGNKGNSKFSVEPKTVDTLYRITGQNGLPNLDLFDSKNPGSSDKGNDPKSSTNPQDVNLSDKSGKGSGGDYFPLAAGLVPAQSPLAGISKLNDGKSGFNGIGSDRSSTQPAGPKIGDRDGEGFRHMGNTANGAPNITFTANGREYSVEMNLPGADKNTPVAIQTDDKNTTASLRAVSKDGSVWTLNAGTLKWSKTR